MFQYLEYKILWSGLFFNSKHQYLNLFQQSLLTLRFNKIFIFYIPFYLRFCLLNGSILYIYSNIYFFFFFINSGFFFFKKGVFFNNVSNNFFKVYFYNFKKFLNQFSLFFFRKIKFSGKGYRIYKGYRNILALQFNKSHRVYSFFYYLGFKLLNKYNAIFFSKNTFFLNPFLYNFKYIRNINIFTLRGIRFSNQLIFKKIGKISSY